MSEKNNVTQRKITLGIVIMLIAFTTRLILINSTSPVYDEVHYKTWGMHYIHSILTHNFSVTDLGMDIENPPIAKYFYGIIYSLCPSPPGIHPYLYGRLLSAFWGALTCLSVFLIGSMMFNLSIGFAAAMYLCFMPHFIAHTSVAGLESPSAFFYAISIYFFLAYINQKRTDTVNTLHTKWGKINLFLFTIFCFFCVGTRFTNITLPFLVTGILLLSRKEFDSKSISFKHSVNLSIFISLLIVFLLFLLTWPHLWIEREMGIRRILIRSSLYDITEYFMGERLHKFPIHYFIVYIGVCTPLGMLIAAVLGLVRIFKDKGISILYRITLLLWFITPLLWSFNPIKQDGIRYVFTMLPPLAILTAIGCNKVDSWIKKFLPLLCRFMPVSVCMFIYLIIACSTVHPFYLDYYNALTGGPAKVYEQHKFEIGWWGEGVWEAVRWVNANAPRDIGIEFVTYPFHDFPPIRSDLVYLPKGSTIPRWLIANTYAEWYFPEEIPPKNVCKPIHYVTVAWSVLTTVYHCIR